MAKKKPVRMIQLMIRATPELVHQIDEWRRKVPDLPGRAEAARRLMTDALERAAAKEERKARAKEQDRDG